MGLIWNFPKYNYGRRDGINHSGIETFRGNRYISLAKEICQNSLDAVLDPKKPVTVDFKLFHMKTKNIPGFIEYRTIVKLCNEYNKEGSSGVREFFQNAVERLERPTIPVLRVSDFNTTGLTGSKNNRDTPWNDLVKAESVSNKSGSDGGSFGIGKFATFANSHLNTVFYHTLDREGINAYQGVALFTNFKDHQNIERDSEGYYTSSNKNDPIFASWSLDPSFKRQETGTDVYVLDFIERENWIMHMIYAIVDSFLLSIYNKNLVVKIDDITIDGNSLDWIVNEYLEYKGDLDQTPKEFYRVLTSEDKYDKRHELITDKGENLGNFRVMFLIDKSLSSRRFLMSRINGMKIFEQGRFSRGIPFSGIVILEDEKINAYFRKMETPRHDSWNYLRFSTDTREANSANETRLRLIRTLRDELQDNSIDKSLEESDVEGLGDYLPSLSGLEEDKDLGKMETLYHGSKKTEIDVSESEPIEISAIETGPITDELGAYKEGPDGISFEGGKDSGGTKDPAGGRKGGIKPGEGSYPFKNRKLSDLGRMRIFKSDKDFNTYRMIFVSERDISICRLYVNIIGEDSESKLRLPISYAYSYNMKKSLDIDEDIIELRDIEKNKTTIIEFETEVTEKFSMEVIINEIKE